MKRSFVFFCFIAFFIFSDGGLISQSSIQSCDWGDSNEPTTKDGAGCKEKLVVSMTLKSGQGEVEALYANINQVQGSEGSGLGSLKKPFRIEVQKSQTITNYRVYYRGSVNALPQEHTSIFSRASHCHDGWYEERPSCSKQESLDGNEEFAWDSQGFCCKCSSYIREIRRSKGVCVGGISEWFKYKGATGYTTYHEDRNMSFGSSAHCMRMDNLWYDVYDIELPMMIYNISVRLLQYEGKVVDHENGIETTNWTTVSIFYLSPSKTIGRSADGKVVVELLGDLVGANSPLDFSAKKLLIPSLKVRQSDENPVPPKAYTNGPSDWLLVDDHMVDLSGKQCNKIGVSYTGFKRQNSPCDKPEHSCFTNQPLQLWTYDDGLRRTGKRGRYMVHNFGRIHPSTHVTDHSFILRFINTDLHNSFVTFRIDAADIVFVYNAAKGRIVDAYAVEFTAVKEVGQLFVDVENTGELQSEYSVVLSECLGRKSTPSKVVSILPGRIANVTFSLQSYKTKGENSLCEVQLFDKSFNLLGTSKVDVTVQGACFCFGECGCTCSSETTGFLGNSTALPCPTPPPVVISKSNLVADIFFLVLESIGIHGIVGFFGSTLIVLGCLKLLCGGVICCRKTKAQEHYDSLIKKGVDPKSPALVKCTGECRGAKAAIARYKRKVERLKKIGKNPGFLDDWRNTSYECNCKDELSDIRFAYIIKAVCFYYYCCFLPFIWLGKKIWWAVFKDTPAKKEAARKAVLNQAKKKGKLEKYGIIDIEAELKNVENERNQSRGETGEKHSQDTTSLEPTMQSAEKTTVANTAGNVGISDKVSDGKENKSLPQSDGKKSKSKKGGKRDKGDRQRVRQEVELQLDKEDRNKSFFESGNKITKSEKESKYEKSQGIQGDKQQASSSSERYSEQQNTGQIPSARRKQEKPREGPADSKTLTSKNVQKRKLLDTNTTSHANNERTKPRASGEKCKAETVKGRAEKQIAMGSRIEKLIQQRATGLGDRVSSQKKAKSPPRKAARGRDLPMKLEKPIKSSRSDSASPGSEVIDKVKGDHHKEFLSSQQSVNKVSLTSKRSDSDASVGNLASANDYSKGISNTCISEFDDNIKASSYSAFSSRGDENSQYVGVHTVDSENVHSSQRSTSQPGLHDGSLRKLESQESKSSSTSEKDLSEIVSKSPSNSDQSLSSKLESNKNIYSSSTNTGSSSTITSSTNTSSTNSSTSSTDSRTGSTNSSSTNTNTTFSSSSVSNSGSNDGSTKLKSGSNTSSTSNGSKSSSASSFTTCFTSSHNSVSNRDESSSSQESDINKHSSGTASTHSTESFASGISSSQQSSTIASISEDSEVDNEQDDSHDSEESPSEVDNEQDDSHDSEESPSEQTSESQESSNEEESHTNDHSSVDSSQSSDSTSISSDNQSHSSTTSDKESSQSSNTVSESQSLSSLDS